MKRLFFLCFIICGLMPRLVVGQIKDTHLKTKEEILAAEAAFCKMAKEKGVEAAFLAFAADDAVISRGNKTYKGKEGIKKYYDKQDKDDKLTWKPSFADASEIGDMGYTYGEYDFSGVRVGNEITDHGIYQTIWKRQKDGSWKFVFD